MTRESVNLAATMPLVLCEDFDCLHAAGIEELVQKALQDTRFREVCCRGDDDKDCVHI